MLIRLLVYFALESANLLFADVDADIIGCLCDPSNLWGVDTMLQTQKRPSFWDGLLNGIVATTYFTRFDPSIIGGSGLNFSVRDGKR
ncbi:hypothetical protein DYBT9623_05531 [Dyadobacter sp. CECT 9623]|uniref:Uncharacterized protein n=1 Tax=Dyadobacter linearis TaxID=2823330 RepID=A0ABM8UYY0_9BACT|nr:hypothetical protein DYBT9623_05531 [Dyadobacter sp. CECT 9623]